MTSTLRTVREHAIGPPPGRRHVCLLGAIAAIAVACGQNNTGNSASLQGSGSSGGNNDDDDDNGADLEITARVSGKNGGCPSITFSGSRTAQTSAGTFFRRVTCELLVDGQLVEVEGPVASGVLRAEKVQLEDAQGVERRGTVTGLSGSCPSLTFSVGGSGPVFITTVRPSSRTWPVPRSERGWPSAPTATFKAMHRR
jgi:Domain of unknown function (DUF5666)